MTVRHDERIDTSLQGHLTRADGGSRLVPIRARLDRPGACRAFIGSRDGCEIDCANQHTGQISRHNLRMKAHAKLTNPFVSNPPAFGAALQSNKVYPPRLSARALAGIVARRISANRGASRVRNARFDPRGNLQALRFGASKGLESIV